MQSCDCIVSWRLYIVVCFVFLPLVWSSLLYSLVQPQLHTYQHLHLLTCSYILMVFFPQLRVFFPTPCVGITMPLNKVHICLPLVFIRLTPQLHTYQHLYLLTCTKSLPVKFCTKCECGDSNCAVQGVHECAAETFSLIHSWQ